MDTPQLVAAIDAAAQIVSPVAILAADLTLDDVPLFALSGESRRLRLVLCPSHPACRSTKELEASLVAASSAVYIDFSFKSQRGARSQPLHARVNVDTLGRCLVVAFLIPPSSSIFLRPVLVSGQPVAGMPQDLTILVRHGLQPPHQIACSPAFRFPLTLCISPAGEVFVPQEGSPSLRVFNDLGTTDHSLARLGLPRDTCWAAVTSCAPLSLLLANNAGDSTSLVSLDQTTQAVSWATVPGALQGCSGIDFIPFRGGGGGVVVVASDSKKSLTSLCPTTGRLLDRIEVPQLHYRLAADRISGYLFGTLRSEGGGYSVAHFSWIAERGLFARGAVEAAGVRMAGRLLAVMPPAAGRWVSHLIVGTWDSSELLVLALPGLALVSSHKLRGVRAWALAADPQGKSLAVCDHATMSVHVLPWPLTATALAG